MELNPGPVRFACGICNRAVKSNQRGLCCDQCDRWFHAECANISCDEYTRLSNSSESWVCAACFHTLTARQGHQDRHHEAREHARSYCGECQRVIRFNNRKIYCDQCNKWYHITLDTQTNKSNTENATQATRSRRGKRICKVSMWCMS